MLDDNASYTKDHVHVIFYSVNSGKIFKVFPWVFLFGYFSTDNVRAATP